MATPPRTRSEGRGGNQHANIYPLSKQASNATIAKNTMALYFRMLLNMGVTFFTSRIVLDTLGIVDYGIYNVVGGIIYLFAFLNTSMSSATQRYLTYEIGRNAGVGRMQEVFSTSLGIHAMISLAMLIIGETVGLYILNGQVVIPADRLQAANWAYQCSVISCCIRIVALPLNALIISHEHMGAFAWISILDVMLKLAVAYLLYITASDKLIVYSLLILLVSMSTPAIYLAYCKRHFPECRLRRAHDTRLLKEMGNFAGWNLIGNMAYIGFTQGVNILLNVFFGPAINAARGVAVQVEGALKQFSGNFQMAANPQMTKRYAANDLRGMHNLLFKSSKFSFFLLFVVSLPVMLHTETILDWWLVEVPGHTVAFFRIIICISAIGVLADPMNICAQATGRIRKYQLVEGGTLLLIVPVSYLSLKLTHVPETVFAVHLCIALAVHFLRIMMLRNMIALSAKEYARNVLLRIAAVTAATLLFLSLIGVVAPSALHGFFACTALSVVASSLAIYGIGLTRAERRFMLNLARNHIAR